MPALRQTCSAPWRWQILNNDEGYRLTVIGRSLANMGEWEQAELVLTRATQANPSFAEAWALLGEAREQVSKDGLPDLEKAVETNPQSIMARAMLALYWGRLGEWDQAISHLQVASRVEPDRAVWRIEIGQPVCPIRRPCQGAGGTARGGGIWSQQTCKPWQHWLTFPCGMTWTWRGSGCRRPKKRWRWTIKMRSLMTCSGQSWLSLIDRMRVKTTCCRALEIDPNLAEAHYHLGSLYLQKQSNDKAYEHLVRAAQLDGSGTTGTLARRLLERYFNQSSEEGGQP